MKSQSHSQFHKSKQTSCFWSAANSSPSFPISSSCLAIVAYHTSNNHYLTISHATTLSWPGVLCRHQLLGLALHQVVCQAQQSSYWHQQAVIQEASFCCHFLLWLVQADRWAFLRPRSKMVLAVIPSLRKMIAQTRRLFSFSRSPCNHQSHQQPFSF